MTNALQLNFNLATKDQLKNTWAFAVDTRPAGRGRRKRADLGRCIISSCSKEAKLLGVKIGMHADEALLLAPGMKILVIGGRTRPQRYT
jgi:hypothetical protein